ADDGFVGKFLYNGSIIIEGSAKLADWRDITCVRDSCYDNYKNAQCEISINDIDCISENNFGYRTLTNDCEQFQE
ncbi:MAG: hypothetical protein ACP5D2_02995, partial [Candidatus Nanoarchaeia archaeon]